MSPNVTLLAGITDWFPWYTWVSAAALVIILVAYRMYQKKMMN